MADYKTAIVLFPNPQGASIILDYLNNGWDPGDFYRAVLANDLKLACQYADGVNKHLLWNIVYWLWNHAPKYPVPSWGSPEDVERWIAMGGMVGLIEQERERAQHADG